MKDSTSKSITLIYYEVVGRNTLMLDKYIYLTSANKIFTADDSPDIIYIYSICCLGSLCNAMIR